MQWPHVSAETCSQSCPVPIGAWTGYEPRLRQRLDPNRSALACRRRSRTARSRGRFANGAEAADTTDMRLGSRAIARLDCVFLADHLLPRLSE